MLDGGGDKHGQDPGVNRMADETVGAAHDQLMIFFQGHGSAPVAPKNGASPETETQPADAEDGGGDHQSVVVRDDRETKWVRQTVSSEDEPGAERKRDQVTQTLRHALAVDGALAEDRGQDPGDDKDAPAAADDSVSGYWLLIIWSWK